MDYPAELFANPFRRRGHRVYLHTSRRPGNREELRERGTQEDGNFRRGLIFVFVLADSPPEADELINTNAVCVPRCKLKHFGSRACPRCNIGGSALAGEGVDYDQYYAD